MPKTFDILKKRWMEVIFLVCFIQFPAILSRVVSYVLRSGRMNYDFLMPLNWTFVIFGIAVYIFYVFFYAGFLRSACVHGDQRQRFGTLYKIGSPFFGQILIFQFIAGLIAMGMRYPTIFIMTRFGAEAVQSYRWVFWLVSLAITIALLKLRFFIPSLIIVRKLNIITAFKALKQYKFFAAKEMLIIFALSYVVRFGGYFIIRLTSVIPPVYSVCQIALQITLHVFSLAIMLSAVKFIYDNTETASEVPGEQVE